MAPASLCARTSPGLNHKLETGFKSPRSRHEATFSVGAGQRIVTDAALLPLRLGRRRDEPERRLRLREEFQPHGATAALASAQIVATTSTKAPTGNVQSTTLMDLIGMPTRSRRRHS